MGGPDMITTSEAWYRLSDVLFWYQSLPENSLERSALGALTHRESLGSPSHPLREKNADGIQVTIAQAAGKELPELRPPSTPAVPPIPLPNHPVLPCFVIETEQVTVNGRDMKKLGERIKKDNKRRERDGLIKPVPETPPSKPDTPTEEDAETTPPLSTDEPASEERAGEESPPVPPSPVLSSGSSATLRAEVLSDEEDVEEEPEVTDPDALPRPEPVGNAELYYRAHIALESARRRSFLAYYLEGQDPSAALAALPEWLGCGTFFSLVPNFDNGDLTDVALCMLCFPLDGNEIVTSCETRHFVIADAPRSDSTPSPGQSEIVHRAELAERIAECLDSAWERGGGGARYFVKHPSERSDLSDLAEIGLDTSEWHTNMQRRGARLAPWTDPEAWGETFEVDIARLLEPMGTAAGIDLSARKPETLCGLFDLEPREVVSAAERAELLIELAGALLEAPLNATFEKFLDRWDELQASLEETQRALRIATERAVADAAGSHQTTEAPQPEEESVAAKAKPKKKKKNKNKKKRKPKSADVVGSADTDAAESIADLSSPTRISAQDSGIGTDTATEVTEDEDSDEEPDFAGGVLIGRDGQLVEYTREV